jgi:hypothetical protein
VVGNKDPFTFILHTYIDQIYNCEVGGRGEEIKRYMKTQILWNWKYGNTTERHGENPCLPVCLNWTNPHTVHTTGQHIYTTCNTFSEGILRGRGL